VVVLIHGGCWQSRYGLHLMDAMAQALTKAGYATWNLEFRRPGPGETGWPYIFHDVVLGVDYLRNLATQFALKLDDVSAIGHSSGGHLALLLAEQALSLSKGSDAKLPQVALRGVVALAPVTDLPGALADPSRSCHAVIESFMGATPAQDPERYRAAAPGAGSPQTPRILISGSLDKGVRPLHVEEYAKAMRSQGVTIRHVEVADAGHFELITPGTRAWDELLQALESLPAAR
jgi:acetyl esterase/lipase